MPGGHEAIADIRDQFGDQLRYVFRHRPIPDNDLARPAGIMQAIEDGMYQPFMKARMEELEREKAGITSRLTEAPPDVPDVHPNVVELYRAQVGRLTDALASPDTHAEAAADVRSLIGEVVITPGEGRGEFTVVLRGELLGILGLVAGEKSSPGPEALTNATARPRNHFCYNSLEILI